MLSINTGPNLHQLCHLLCRLSSTRILFQECSEYNYYPCFCNLYLCRIY